MTRNRTLRVLIGTLGFISITLAAGTARGQFTADYQTNTISGVTSNWVGDYYIGNGYSFDQLQTINGGALLDSGTLNVGYNGGSGNSLVVSNGGAVVNATGYIGHNANNNWALVTGSGSVWSNQDLNVGYYGGSGNSLVISNGGKVVTADVGVSGYANGVSANGNSALVSGNGSVWSINNTLFVASHSSSNSLTINNGGVVDDVIGCIGNYGDYNGVVVSGVGSVWGNASTLYVGNFGNANSLVISNGGMAVSGTGIIGYRASNNNVLVNNPGSVWSNTSALYVGTFGSGNSLVISNGGKVVTADVGVIGYADGTHANNNNVLVTGTGSVWSIQSNLYIGFGTESGNSRSGNSLVIDDGGEVSNQGSLQIGIGGSGNSLVIESGGKLNNATGSGYIGVNNFFVANNNSVLVTGIGSVWNNQSDLYIGFGRGIGNSLVIDNGGAVVNASGYIGFNADSNSVLVAGSGSVWSNRYDLYVGYNGTGNRLVVTNGGAVFDDSGYLGANNACSNNVTVVSGNGAIWQNRSDLYVGYFGDTNTLTIDTGGSVIARNAYVGFWPGADGNKIDVTGGSLCVTNTLGNGTLDIRRGKLDLNGGNVIVDQLTATNGANSVINFNAGTIQTKGTTVNNGSAFTVGNGSSAAVLNLQGGTHSFANDVLINTNASLTGNGTIQGNVTSSGRISPGNSPGTITINGNLALQTISIFDIQLDGLNQGTDYDTIFVNGSVSLGGLLQVSFINGFETNVLNSEGFIVLQGNSPLGGTFSNLVSNQYGNSQVLTAGGEGYFDVEYTGNAVTLSGYHGVPEPSTLALGAAGLIGVFMARWRWHGNRGHRR